MNLYFAPLEGITTYVYRNAHHEFFGGIDKYFTPFLSPSQKCNFNPKEMKEILPDNNKNITIIPQLLTNNSEYFICTAKGLKEYGYKEVNLNLGCPSGTVTAKGKGAGFLAKKEELNIFLQEIFEKIDMDISVKTRIGVKSPDEFYELIEIYNKYPMKELIIHPRIREDFYKNQPNWKVFADAMKLSKNRLCYNGDIFTKEIYKQITGEFHAIDTVMIGRGFIWNPGLVTEINGSAGVEKERLEEFHDRIYSDYIKEVSGGTNVLFKMKEIWFYMIHLFEDSDTYLKKIRKASNTADYEIIVKSLFRESELIRKK